MEKLIFLLFLLLDDFGLGSEGLRQGSHLVRDKRISRVRRDPLCGDRLLTDCFSPSSWKFNFPPLVWFQPVSPNPSGLRKGSLFVLMPPSRVTNETRP